MCSVAVRYSGTSIYQNEPLYKYPRYHERFLPHSTTKIYEKEPPYNETSLWRTKFAGPLALQPYILSGQTVTSRRPYCVQYYETKAMSVYQKKIM